jgi:N-methylhydantoinase A/oxoprolinase/acetone carboxylase beta subunit
MRPWCASASPLAADRAATGRTPEQVAEGFEIAVGNMANAIKKISVQRGYDVTATR